MAGEKIVVIEDEKDILKSIVTLLEEEGYEVFPAKNGKEGILQIKANLPSIILCDILMPDIDGYEVLAEIQKDKRTRSVPFIFVTAKVERQDVRRGMQLGADDYIFKPFTPDELLMAINARLKKRDTLIADIDDGSKNTNEKKYKSDGKLVVKVGGVPKFIKITDIIYINAERQYSSIRIQGGKSFLIRKSINKWESTLPNTNFLRIHRATIINTDFIIKIEKWHNAAYLIYLRDIKEPFNISKRYATKLRHTHL